MTLDLTERHSALALLIGGTTFLINVFAMGQANVQRYMSLPSIKSARKALLFNIAGILAMISMCCLSGLLLYAKYFDCDPLETKLVTAKDQLLPLLVMENMGNIPGFAGLFIAGVFSASLSSLSTALNSTAAVVLEDFWKPNTTKVLTERKTAFIMRGTVFVLGAISVVLVSVVEKMGGVLQLAMSITAASAGPTFGLFFIGFFLPWIKAKVCERFSFDDFLRFFIPLNIQGTLIGAAVSITITMYVAMRAQGAQALGELSYATKPTSTEGCSYTFNPVNTSALFNSDLKFDADESFHLYDISYQYYSFFGSLITIVVAYIVTLIDRDTDPTTVDVKLLAPFLRKYFPTKDELPVQVINHVFDNQDNKLETDNSDTQL